MDNETMKFLKSRKEIDALRALQKKKSDAYFQTCEMMQDACRHGMAVTVDMLKFYFAWNKTKS